MRRHTKSAAQWFSPTDRRRLERALSTVREARLYRRIEAVLLVAEGHRSATRPSACAPRGSVFAGGSNAPWRPMMPPPWRTGRAMDDRTQPRGSPHAAWRQPWRTTRAAAAIKPRVGRCHCSGSICSDVTASPSVPERCAGASMRPIIAGSDLAMSMPGGGASGPEKGGIIRRLRAEWCTGDVLLCCDWTLLRLFPPLRATWARKGTQATVPITGANAKRVLFGAIDLRTAHRVVLIRPRAGAADAQAFLHEIRRRYRSAGTIWLLADRASAHTAARTQMLAAALDIRFLWLPKQAPELNAMDQLWRELKRLIAANRQAASADALASNAAGWVLGLTPQQARRKAGMASKHYWLRNLVNDFWPPT